MNAPNIVRELDILLHNEQKILQMKEDYAKLKKILSSRERASEKAAMAIVNFTKSVNKN
jgi:lipid A disaccharide synthetase